MTDSTSPHAPITEPIISVMDTATLWTNYDTPPVSLMTFRLSMDRDRMLQQAGISTDAQTKDRLRKIREAVDTLELEGADTQALAQVLDPKPSLKAAIVSRQMSAELGSRVDACLYELCHAVPNGDGFYIVPAEYARAMTPFFARVVQHPNHPAFVEPSAPQSLGTDVPPQTRQEFLDRLNGIAAEVVEYGKQRMADMTKRDMQQAVVRG